MSHSVSLHNCDSTLKAGKHRGNTILILRFDSDMHTLIFILMLPAKQKKEEGIEIRFEIKFYFNFQFETRF